ncbi:hypothetical protein diail_849 [Diaporthe ilicicola]|nr:hypothetical protein diail_849 [Diaporthe ilicicola]
MPSKADPSRNRPTAGQGGSTSAAFAFATEPTEVSQHDRPVSPSNVSNLDPGLVDCSLMAAPTTIPNSSTATSIPTSEIKDGEVTSIAVENATAEIDKLENEVIHFMSLSLEEREKSEVLSGRLATVTQRKDDLERQVDEIDQNLGRIGFQSKQDGCPEIDSGDAISRVNAKITNLRVSAEKRENDLSSLALDNSLYSKTIAQLEQQLSTATKQVSQRTEDKVFLAEELEQTKEALRSEEKINHELLGDIKTLEQECDELRISSAWNGKQLAETEQTVGNLKDLVNQKISELEAVTEAGKLEAKALRHEIDCKQKHIENLTAARKTGTLKREMSEPSPKGEMRKRLALQFSSKGGSGGSTPSQQVGMAAQSESEKRHQRHEYINSLEEELQSHQKRRIRAIAIGIDFSASAEGDLADGIKRLYAHLLNELKKSPCQTYVMTVVHGPDLAASVRSQFGDTWETHEKVLEGQRPNGYQQHVACLRKIKQVAVSTGLVLDLQVILLGDGDTDGDSTDGSQAVLADYSSSNPTVHIHSVVVKTGTAEEWEVYWSNQEDWRTWNYASGTGGNMMVWWTNNPLPDLRSLVF